MIFKLSTKVKARMHFRQIAVAVARTSALVLAAALFFFPTSSLLHFANSANAGQSTSASFPDVAVGAQYDSTHVYIASGDLDAFVKSFTATFGG